MNDSLIDILQCTHGNACIVARSNVYGVVGQILFDLLHLEFMDEILYSTSRISLKLAMALTGSMKTPCPQIPLRRPSPLHTRKEPRSHRRGARREEDEKYPNAQIVDADVKRVIRKSVSPPSHT